MADPSQTVHTGKLIVFEGFDGTGKSAMTNHVVNTLGFVNLSRLPGSLAHARHIFDDARTEITERAAFYMGVNMYHSLRAQEAVQSGQNVVLDRYYFSTLASHTVSPDQHVQMMHMCTELMQPDIWFYLHADFETITRRMERRRHMSANDRAVLNHDRYADICQAYEKGMPQNCIRIDSTQPKAQMKNIISEHVLRILN